MGILTGLHPPPELSNKQTLYWAATHLTQRDTRYLLSGCTEIHHIDFPGMWTFSLKDVASYNLPASFFCVNADKRESLLVTHAHTSVTMTQYAGWRRKERRRKEKPSVWREGTSIITSALAPWQRWGYLTLGSYEKRNGEDRAGQDIYQAARMTYMLGEQPNVKECIKYYVGHVGSESRM